MINMGELCFKRNTKYCGSIVGMLTGPEFPGSRKLFPFPGNKFPEREISGALNNANGVHGIHSQVSGDVINVGGRSATLFG